MSREVKQLVIIWAIVFTMLIGAHIALRLYVRDTPTVNRTPVQYASCPAGSFDSGGGGCKLEPTGCPNGDSTPMELCYKSVPKIERLPAVSGPGK